MQVWKIIQMSRSCFHPGSHQTPQHTAWDSTVRTLTLIQWRQRHWCHRTTPGIRRCPAAGSHTIPTSPLWGCLSSEKAQESPSCLWFCHFQILCKRSQGVLCPWWLRFQSMDILSLLPVLFSERHLAVSWWRGGTSYNPGTQEDNCESELHRRFQVSLGCRMRSCLNNNNNNNVLIYLHMCICLYVWLCMWVHIPWCTCGSQRIVL